MKKSVLIFAFAAFFGFATFASDKNVAQNPVETQQQQDQRRQDQQQDQRRQDQQQQDQQRQQDMQRQQDQQQGRQHGQTDTETTEINVNEVPQAVRTAVQRENRNASIESARTKVLPTGETVYKVKLTGVGEEESTKMFHANGTEYTEGTKNKDRERSR
jgi:DNA polymerase III alpha subunit (gram-positive type)